MIYKKGTWRRPKPSYGKEFTLLKKQIQIVHVVWKVNFFLSKILSRTTYVSRFCFHYSCWDFQALTSHPGPKNTKISLNDSLLSSYLVPFYLDLPNVPCHIFWLRTSFILYLCIPSTQLQFVYFTTPRSSSLPHKRVLGSLYSSCRLCSILEGLLSALNWLQLLQMHSWVIVQKRSLNFMRLWTSAQKNPETFTRNGHNISGEAAKIGHIAPDNTLSSGYCTADEVTKIWTIII